ncbi:MAG: hypothetical protein ACXU9U_06065 [Parachlamydiaceae bacterium]
MSSPVNNFRNYFVHYAPDESISYLPDVPEIQTKTNSSATRILTPDNLRNSAEVTAFLKQTLEEMREMNRISNPKNNFK